MKKYKLPKDWIVVQSKSRPDRVYYFNVKTNERSWFEPGQDKPNQVSMETEPSRKRKKCNDGIPSQPNLSISSPEHNTAEGIKISARPKRRAKRILRSVEEKDTPEMQKIREKILQKKAKSLPSTSATSSKYSADTTVHSKLENTISNNKSTTVSRHSDLNKKETYTPQMHAILEKMQHRKFTSQGVKEQGKNSNAESNKVLNISAVKATKNKKNTLRMRSKLCPTNNESNNSSTSQYISGGTSINTSTNLSIQDSTVSSKTSTEHDGSNAMTNLLKEKTDISSKDLRRSGSINSTSLILGKQSRRKKNLAKQRLETLKRSLNSNNTELSTSLCNRRLLSSTDKDQSNVVDNTEERSVRRSCRKIADNLTESDCALQPSSSTTIDGNTLIGKCRDTEDCEEMDWEPLQDEKIMFEVQAVRTQLYTDTSVKQMNSVPGNTLEVPLMSDCPESKTLYVVVDTNVLLSNIAAVEELRDATFKTYGLPVIVIPWTVICELDYIKDDKSAGRSEALRAKARHAVRFLNQHFTARHPRVVGQAPEDVVKNKEIFARDCPDDEILQTCLQIRELGKPVVLLSYDKNLCNKAMIFDVVTLGRNDPFEKLDFLNLNTNKNESLWHYYTQNTQNQESTTVSFNRELRICEEILQDAKNVITNFLKMIVVNELQSLYGEHWEKYAAIRPPWTTADVFKCAAKHWIAAISGSFVGRTEVMLQELQQIFTTLSEGSWKLEETHGVLHKCSSFIQMVNNMKYSNLVTQAMNSIDKLKEKCLTYENQISQKKFQEEIGVEDNVSNQIRRAEKAFQCFEEVYAYARDMCGLAAEVAGMPCSFFYKHPNPLPTADHVMQVQPEIAANVNRLLHNLSTALEQIGNFSIDHRAVFSLYHTLTTFVHNELTRGFIDLAPLDVYCCLLQKEEALKTGLRQLQDLSVHFCKLASYKCR